MTRWPETIKTCARFFCMHCYYSVGMAILWRVLGLRVGVLAVIQHTIALMLGHWPHHCTYWMGREGLEYFLIWHKTLRIWDELLYFWVFLGILNIWIIWSYFSFPHLGVSSQQCNSAGCLLCPATINKANILVNNKTVSFSKSLNCKSRNVINLRFCKICDYREAYFGRTTQECHDRTSGHRQCFCESKWDKSALSMHAKEVHASQFSLNNFSVAVVKKVSPQHLRREEFRFIDKYKTIPLGLNRYKV